ncbi:hemolysin family protein [Sediminivirga luteola]|uniref:Membrane protein n=1 Tax=Sediminivirga luteola TaxID=1774748 RepID=A0A8J2TWX1_9MICO|nr:hemolysin family protein [Sediminivirga luteola]MCI2265495.1 hemolysin family protein [Sediminivirga luteola]GGA10161.1 membrane protein [Sediminivirga luteola]
MIEHLLVNVLLVVLFVLIGGVFAATEMALVTLRDSQVDALATRGKRGSKVATLARSPNTFLSAVQIGVTVAGFFSAAYGASSIAPSVAPVLMRAGVPETVAGTAATIVLTLLIAYLSLVLGELVPKRLAIQRNAAFAYAVAPVLGGFATLMRPVIWLLSVSTDAVVRLLGGDPDTKAQGMTHDELRSIVSTHEGLPEDERRMLGDVLTIRDRQLSEVMTPRPDVIALESGQSIAQALAQVEGMPYSRYPVTEASIDDIIGFVHVRDLLEQAIADDSRPLSSAVRDLPYFPASARVLPTLTAMRAANRHIAVVIDEYGGTDGIVTMEDLIEEVVGEIFDEYDTEVQPHTTAEGDDIVDARLNLQDFAEATGIELERGTYDTVAGYVTARLGRLARVGDAVDVGEATLKVTTVDHRRIAEVAVIRHGGPQTTT